MRLTAIRVVIHREANVLPPARRSSAKAKRSGRGLAFDMISPQVSDQFPLENEGRAIAMLALLVAVS